MERWEEEEHILRKEFEFTYLAFKFQSDAWTKTITSLEIVRPRHVAFAHERASMYLKMANDCSAAYESITGEQLHCASNKYARSPST